MSPLNVDYLREQFRLMEEYLSRASRLSARSEEDFLSDPILVDAAVREITVLFETAHNVAKHIISNHDWKAPKSKAEAFEILASKGILPPELAGAFQRASRFRNLATYQTSILNDRTVFQILQDHLQDFRDFLTRIAAWLERAKS